MFNELYARDTSKKIRSAFRTQMKDGLFVAAFAPYGYRRDPDNRHRLVIDEEAAKTVRYIYQEAADGTPPIQIARALNASHTPTPLEHRYANRPDTVINTRRKWTSSTVLKILKNIVYLGHLAQGKTTKVSFKSNLVINNPERNWYVVRDTHEPIVSQELFDMASRRSRQRTCTKKGGFHNLFSGIAKCADCGRNMSTIGTRKKGAVANLACGGYKLYGSQTCSNHFIDYTVLYHLVLDALKHIMRLSNVEKQKVIAEASRRMAETQNTRKQAEKTAAIHRRLKELDCLIEKVYDDYGSGILSADRVQKLLIKYEKESESLKQQLMSLDMDKPTLSKGPDLEHILHSILEPETLSQDLLYKLIDRIEIGQGAYQKTEHGRTKHQCVKIYFRFQHRPMTKVITPKDIRI